MLIHRVIKLYKKISILAVIILLFNQLSCFASSQSQHNDLWENMSVSQEKSTSNGVLISRPNPLDERIRDLIIFGNIRTLDDYAKWLKGYMKYVKDRKKDAWAAPEETLLRKGGDCEDFAFLNEAVLRVCGYKPKVLAIVRILGSHAICVFKEGEYYSLFDNTRLIRTKAKATEELAKYLLVSYNYSSLYTINLKTKDWDILFKHSDLADDNL